MKTQNIGSSDLVTSRLVYGSGTWDPSEITPTHEEKAIAAVMAAYEAGYTHFDHADIYARGESERIFGKALKEHKGMRDEIIITSKVGICFENEPEKGDPHRWDFSKEHILWSCEQSLKRMGIDKIDLYLLHRPDSLAEPEEIASAFAELKKQGKVDQFGVSNFRPSLLTAVQKACDMPLITNQVQCSLGHLEFLGDGTLDQCLGDDITPMAYSPLAGGLLGNGAVVDKADPQAEGKQGLLDVLDAIASDHSTTRIVVALAWLLRHPSKIIPVIGSANPSNIKEAAKADDLDLSRTEWYRLLHAARMKGLP